MPFEGVEPWYEVRTIKLGALLQRLFSTFPNGWPGIGLLLLRACLGVALVYFGIAGLEGKPNDSLTLARYLIADIGGVFLLAGLWTPVIGTVVAIDEVWIALSLYTREGKGAWMSIFLAALAASVAMLGPGASSIDARLFGRKRFDFDRTKGGRPSL
jgi:putative oxidoreductase